MRTVIEAPQFPTEFRWPAAIHCGVMWLTPARQRHMRQVQEIRSRNYAWLSPWDATNPDGRTAPSTRARVRTMWDQARRGLMAPWLIRVSDPTGGPHPIIGQVTVSNVVYGSALTASIGYWIDQDYAGRSLMPAAVALASDHAMFTMGLHRIEVCVRPENRASLRVVEKLGFRYEGRRPRFIHIAGDWRDHEVFALTKEDVPRGLLARVPQSVLFADQPSTHGWMGLDPWRD